MITDKISIYNGFKAVLYERYTFATIALQNGVDIKTLSHTLGHYSSGFTLDTYTHVTTKMQEEAAEKMGNFMAMTL